ncbi:MAG: Minf_1886 family protein [Vicinamibacterales bacterium]
MSTTSSKSTRRRLKYHPDAYKFVFMALQYTQERLGRSRAPDADEERAHITGPELLHGIRELALKQFGLLTQTVFCAWGVSRTDDFGHIVFDLVERGEMRKTERDHVSDFYGIYEFEEAFDREYRIDIASVFRK